MSTFCPKITKCISELCTVLSILYFLFYILYIQCICECLKDKSIFNYFLEISHYKIQNVNVLYVFRNSSLSRFRTILLNFKNYLDWQKLLKTITYACNTGYELKYGSLTLQRIDDKTWNASISFCCKIILQTLYHCDQIRYFILRILWLLK